MTRRAPSAALAVAILALLGAVLGWSAVAGAAPGDGWLATGDVQAPGGPYLTDSLGRRLVLHGVNLVAKCGGGAIDTTAAGTPCVGPAAGPRLAYVLAPAAGDPGRRFTAADAQTLNFLGFNVVRLGLIWEGLEPGPAPATANEPRYCAPHRAGSPFPKLGAADPYDPATVHAYLHRTDRIIHELAGAGIRVLLDMHSDVWGSAFSYGQGATPWDGEGAPLWATCSGPRPFVAPPGWGSAYAAPPVQNAIHHFWANDVRADLQGQYARVLQAVAAHYRGNPEVIGYELYNEPNDFRSARFDAALQCDYGGPRQEPRSCAAAHVAALPTGLIGALQAADPTHLVFYEPSGATDYGLPEKLGIDEPLRFPRLVLAFHAYGDIPAQIRQTLAERDRTRTLQPGGPAWIMDEFGASNAAAPTAHTVDTAALQHLSWTYWAAFQLHDPTAGDYAEGLLDSVTRRPIPAMARALSVPYPWATAGIPGPDSYDRATGTYRYRYTVDRRIHAPTELELPRWDYPAGYTVAVTGANVVSPPGDRLLELEALPKARRVAVTVRRRPGGG